MIDHNVPPGKLGLFAAALAGWGILVTVSPALAASPVAIVEDVKAPGAKIGFMDYLESGFTIKLGRDGCLVVGYLKSCLRETITGGTVTVGEGQSTVAGGQLSRERVECDGGQMQLTSAQSGKSGAVVMRNAPKAGSLIPSTPQFRIFSTRPIIKLSKPGAQITIIRLGRTDAPIVIGTTGGFADLADADKGLAAGGLYRVDAQGHSVVFSVDAFATDEKGTKAGPAIGRLIRL